MSHDDSAPQPEAGQVWIALEDERDQDTIVAVQRTNLPGVELIRWGGMAFDVHTLVDPEAAKADGNRLYGLGRRYSWPPIGRYLARGPGAPWSPAPL